MAVPHGLYPAGWAPENPEELKRMIQAVPQEHPHGREIETPSLPVAMHAQPIEEQAEKPIREGNGKAAHNYKAGALMPKMNENQVGDIQKMLARGGYGKGGNDQKWGHASQQEFMRAARDAKIDHPEKLDFTSHDPAMLAEVKKFENHLVASGIGTATKITHDASAPPHDALAGIPAGGPKANRPLQGR